MAGKRKKRKVARAEEVTPPKDSADPGKIYCPHCGERVRTDGTCQNPADKTHYNKVVVLL